jgi:hypothetical protein
MDPFLTSNIPENGVLGNYDPMESEVAENVTQYKKAPPWARL